MLFFFFKQKTAYEMRISDWSSDVCSSDLFSNEIRDLQHLSGRSCNAMPWPCKGSVRLRQLSGASLRNLLAQFFGAAFGLAQAREYHCQRCMGAPLYSRGRSFRRLDDTRANAAVHSPVPHFHVQRGEVASRFARGNRAIAHYGFELANILHRHAIGA